MRRAFQIIFEIKTIIDNLYSSFKWGREGLKTAYYSGHS